MKKFKQLSKAEMKNVLGGTGNCYVTCGDVNGGYYYQIANCNDFNPFGACGDPSVPGRCGCGGA